VPERTYEDDEELPRDSAPEAAESEDAEPEAVKSAAKARPRGALQRTASAAAGAARDSADGVVRGSVAVAEGAFHVTYWPAAL
jgi:hypothetical protein